MHNTYLIEYSSVSVLRSQQVLIDTNFLIDATIFKKEVADLIAQLNGLGCTLLTTRAVIVEALGGTKGEVDIRDKANYLEVVFGRPFDEIVSLPIEQALPDTRDLMTFSRQCNKFDTTDFELF